MKIYSSKISQKTIDYKKNYVYQIVDKVKRGIATPAEISSACDTVYWLWKWKIIDKQESDMLADMLTDAMEDNY